MIIKLESIIFVLLVCEIYLWKRNQTPLGKAIFYPQPTATVASDGCVLLLQSKQ